jgi:hypothetical protein
VVSELRVGRVESGGEKTLVVGSKSRVEPSRAEPSELEVESRGRVLLHCRGSSLWDSATIAHKLTKFPKSVESSRVVHMTQCDIVASHALYTMRHRREHIVVQGAM